MRLHLLYFFALFVSFSAVGQQMQFDSAERFLSMPALESYNIMQDSKGYIWFATEQGLCRYDGTSVTVFDRKNGLPEGAVYSMIEDKKGTLWMLTSKRRILVYKNGKLGEAVFSKAFNQLTSNTEIPYSIVLLPDGKFYINTDLQTFEANPDSGRIVLIPKKTVSERYILIWKQNMLLPFHGWRYNNNYSYSAPASKEYTVALLKPDSSTVRIKVQKDSPDYVLRVNAFNTPRGTFFPLGNNKLVRIGNDDKYEMWSFPHRVLWVFCDSEGDLWLGLREKGIYCYRNADLSSKPVVSLQNCSVSGITEDSEKNIWCTTLEKGVFVCRNKNLVNYFNITGLNQSADLLSSVSDKTFISSETHELIVIEPDGIYHKNIHHTATEPLSDITFFNNMWLLGGKEMLCRLDMKIGKVTEYFEKKYYKLSAQKIRAVRKKSLCN